MSELVSTKTSKDGAAKSIVVTDSQGRQLTYQPLNLLAQTRLMDVVGHRAQNGPLFGIYLTACSISDIDGIGFPPPSTFPQVEAAVERLGDGIQAVIEALQDQGGAEERDGQVAVKNS
jgi:hypothetical protein